MNTNDGKTVKCSSASIVFSVVKYLTTMFWTIFKKYYVKFSNSSFEAARSAHLSRAIPVAELTHGHST